MRAWTPRLLVALLVAGPALFGAGAEKPSVANAKTDAEKPTEPFSKETFEGLKLRLTGPAVNSGRVVDLAVDPARPSRYVVAVASGGVWTTANAGATFTPVFDKENSYSIGCVALDPKNPAVIWVGSGENNSQRSVGYGDGVYKSEDGGGSWKNMGLKTSEHIGKIIVDPRDSKAVYVAAQGPLWGPGGDRGLYKTLDGGKTWKAVLTISENTGVSDLVLDPRDADVLYASAYQRRRHVWTLIDGGPESAIYKSTDGGASWTKLTAGLPEFDLGRIGLAVSPADPDVVYATVEAADGKGGFFRSKNRGATWEKMSDYFAGGAQYYAEIVADPTNVDRVYAMDVFMMVTDDGGKNFHRVGEKSKHVDDHALWIDPRDTEHLLAGCDGGIYESYDRGANWRFMANLPVTQFYRVAADNSQPFYFVYGGTQDNNSLGGPSRTVNEQGIANADWFVTCGGDGFQSQIDPQDPNIVYSQSQYGGLVRYDRRSGEAVGVRPDAAPGEELLRWNWDSPLLLSRHSPTRLYFAAQKIFRSDDRGGSWKAVSGDLTRRLDRNALPVMGRVWGPDAVAKNSSTSFYGNVVALAESRFDDKLLIAGTDDGLIQVTDDGGGSWRKIEKFPGVPEMSYVSRIVASRHDRNVIYAAFDDHKRANFKPYLLKSTDLGRTWRAVAGDLPGDDFVLALAEDFIDPGLLFAGTEHGLFFTNNGGARWIRLTGSFPTIAVRDLAIQERETDLVVGTFGRGIYILDDYSPLRTARPDSLAQEALLFPVKSALAYIPALPLGGRGKSQQGESYYTADNPPFGAVFTYYLKDGLKTRKELRQEREKAARKKNQTLPYPTPDELRAEALEAPPAVLLIVTDLEGGTVRRIPASRDKGLHRTAWDLRWPSSTPTRLTPPAERAPWDAPDVGPLAPTGRYKVSLARDVNGELTVLAGPVDFDVLALNRATLPAPNPSALAAFERQVARLQRAALGALRSAEQTKDQLAHIQKALLDAPAADPKLLARARALDERVDQLLIALRGDEALRARSDNTPTSITERVQSVVDDLWTSTSAPSRTDQDAYRIASDQLTTTLGALRGLVDNDLAQLERDLEAAGAPWTPGRLPVWP